MTRSVLKFYLLAIFLVATSAQGADDPHEARVLYLRGSVAFKNGDDALAREHYLESLALEESFETMCNLARTEARAELFSEAYEHIQMCLYLFPKVEELQGAREKYSGLRDHLRTELTYEEAYPIDKKVDEEIARREAEAAAPPPDEPPSPKLDSTEAPSENKTQHSTRIPVSATIGSLGVVGLGTGLVFHLLSQSHYNKATDLGDEIPGNSGCLEPDPHPKCGELHEELRKTDSRANVANVSYIVGGSLLVGAVATYFLWPEPKEDKAWVRPSVDYAGTRGWQVGVEGIF